MSTLSLIEMSARRSSPARVSQVTTEQISANPKRTGRAPGRSSAGASVAIIAAVSFAVVVAGGAAYFVLVPSRPTPTIASTEPGSGQPASPLAAPAAPPAETPPALVIPPPSPDGLVARIRQVAQGFRCAEIKPTITGDNRVRLEGYLSIPADLDRLGRAVGSIGDVGQINLEGIAVHYWPSCLDLTGLLDRTAAPAHPEAAPHLAFNNTSLVYKAGDELIVEASAANAFDGYLYVDFIDSKGAVAHLLPAPAHNHPENRVRAGETRTLGGGDDYRADEPFGLNLVVAISAPRRLFSKPRQELEQANDYLPALKAALEAAARDPRGPRPIATSVLIETVAN